MFWWLPTILCAMALGAHFLRAQQTVITLLFLLAPFLLLVRRPWALRSLQAALLVGAFEWLRTTAVMVQERVLFNEPWLRMVLIMGGVTLATMVSAWGLTGRRPALWFRLREPGTDEQ